MEHLAVLEILVSADVSSIVLDCSFGVNVS